jgi:hypothetical protein
MPVKVSSPVTKPIDPCPSFNDTNPNPTLDGGLMKSKQSNQLAVQNGNNSPFTNKYGAKLKIFQNLFENLFIDLPCLACVDRSGVNM